MSPVKEPEVSPVGRSILDLLSKAAAPVAIAVAGWAWSLSADLRVLEAWRTSHEESGKTQMAEISESMKSLAAAIESQNVKIAEMQTSLAVLVVQVQMLRSEKTTKR